MRALTISIRVVAIAAGAATLAFLLGCGQPPEKEAAQDPETAATPSQASPDSSAASSRVVNPGVVVSKELPANFPKDLPQHPDAKVIESRATSDLGLAIVLVVRDDASKVASFYADGLASQGWATDVRNMPGGTTVFADKGKRTAAVTVTEGRRGAEVRMIVGHL